MTKDCCQTRNCCCYWKRIRQKTRSFRTKNTRGLVSRVSRNPSACPSLELQKKMFHSCWCTSITWYLPLQSENYCRQVRGVMYFAQCSGECRFLADIATCSQDSADPFLNLAWYQIRSWITFTLYMVTNCVSGIMIYWIHVISTPTRMPYREKGLHYKIVSDL